MIKITIELWPFGSEDGKKVIGEAKIWNDGSGDIKYGNYGFDLKNNFKGYIGTFKRSQYNIWWLLAGILSKLYPKVNEAFTENDIFVTKLKKNEL